MRRLALVVLVAVGLMTGGTSTAGAAKPAPAPGTPVVGFEVPFQFPADPDVAGNCLVTFYWSSAPEEAVDHYQYVLTADSLSPKGKRWQSAATSTTATSMQVSVPSGADLPWLTVAAVGATGSRSGTNQIGGDNITC